ncbi:hypothetical protein MFRU_033g00320 [Monilinia fructicola]|nr:hypothetical protein MFRU_033g00320 [Monilinia fructicola]
MDDQQRYRLADTLNHHTYPQRVAILELCLIDNQYMRDIAQAHLELMRRRRWLIERSNIQLFQTWLTQLEGVESELRRLKECHLTVLEPERSFNQGWHVATWNHERLSRHLRSFGISF